MPNIELKIILQEETGGLQVQGPIDNRMLSYGMLEMAKEVIMKRAIQAKPSAIIPVAGVIGDITRDPH